MQCWAFLEGIVHISDTCTRDLSILQQYIIGWKESDCQGETQNEVAGVSGVAMKRACTRCLKDELSSAVP